jgi:DNA-binding beta-propeller fold protein YncE
LTAFGDLCYSRRCDRKLATSGPFERLPEPGVATWLDVPRTPIGAGRRESAILEAGPKEEGEPMMRILAALAVATVLLAGSVEAGASGTLYAADAVGRDLYEIDTATWAVTHIGYHGVASGFCGLAYDRNEEVLVGLTRYTTARLYSIDPNTAAASLIGSLGIGYVYEGGLVFDQERGLLYGANAGSNEDPHVFTVDPLTGAGTILGKVGSGPHDFAGLIIWEDGELYGLDRETNAVWKIDVTDTEGPGTVQLGAGLGAGIELGPVGGMTSDEFGNVYGYASDSHQIFSVDMSTGEGTVLHTFDASVPVFYALAGAGGTPSPVEETSWTSIKAMFNR